MKVRMVLSADEIATVLDALMWDQERDSPEVEALIARFQGAKSRTDREH